MSGFLQDGPDGEPSAGRGWVFDGAATVAAGQGVVEYSPKDPTPRASEAFGFTASKTDYNKDGTPDLYLSGLQGQNIETYLFDGRDGSLLKTLALPASEAQASAMGNNGSGLGASSRAPGDLNGDGEPDFVATAHTQDVNGVQDQGKLYFFLSNVPASPMPTPTPMIGNRGRPCGGRIKIGTRAGSRRVATTTARMGRNCRYSKKYTVAVRRLPKRLRPRSRTLVLRIAVRFQGNSQLKGDLSPTKRVKVRR